MVCASKRGGWDFDPGGLLPTLCDSTCYNTFTKMWTWNLICFYLFINIQSTSDLWCYCISSCCIHVISWFESQKCMDKPYHKLLYWDDWWVAWILCTTWCSQRAVHHKKQYREFALIRDEVATWVFKHSVQKISAVGFMSKYSLYTV